MALNDELDAMLSASQPKRTENQFAKERAEIGDYVRTMKDLYSQHPDDSMGWLSSVSARCLEIMNGTVQSQSRAATKFRIDELIPFRDECRFQFQIASRRVAHNQLEAEVSRGGV